MLLLNIDTDRYLLTSDLGEFSPHVSRYTPGSLEGTVLEATNTSILNVRTNGSGRLVWDIPSGRRYRVGFVYFGSPSGVSEYFVLDIENNLLLLPDFEPFTDPGDRQGGSTFSYSDEAIVDVGRNWSVSLADIETVSTTARIALRGYSHTPSLAETTGLTGSGSLDSIALTWNDVVNADRYRVEVTDPSDVITTRTSSSNSYVYTGLARDTIFSVRIRAEGRASLYGTMVR